MQRLIHLAVACFQCAKNLLHRRSFKAHLTHRDWPVTAQKDLSCPTGSYGDVLLSLRYLYNTKPACPEKFTHCY